MKWSLTIFLDVGLKPSEKPELQRHIILAEDTQRYVKSDGGNY
jgi:hypothetical protein